MAASHVRGALICKQICVCVSVGAVPIWGGMRHLGEGAKISVFSQDLAQVTPPATSKP